MNKWQELSIEELTIIVNNNNTWTGLNKSLGYNGSDGHRNKKLKQYLQYNNIDYNHFKIPNRQTRQRKINNDYNNLSSPATIKKHLLQQREYKCECCGIKEWCNKPIILQLHHIDGNRTNNTRENLLLLCPNCHSQTENYCYKNLHRIDDSEILNIINDNKTIYQICLTVGLNPTANNYARVKSLMSK